MPRTVAMIMAGGKGSRLSPLTVHRAKPAMPFAGRYRIIDFVLSNFMNSGYRRIYVLTQFMASSLIKHLMRNWRLSGINDFIEVVPAQMRIGEVWYRGTADAVFQNLNLVRDEAADNVAIFGGDHVYKIAIDQMDDQHVETGADLTVAAFPVPRSEASRFGVIEVDDQGHIVGFEEKPADPKPIPGRPDECLVSMGNYIFRAAFLEEVLRGLARDEGTSYDFGKDVIPYLVEHGADVRIYDFGSNRIPGEPPGAAPYWRDVGTVDSYFDATMEVRSPLPTLNLYNRWWRIRTAQRDFPPARFVRGERGSRPGFLTDSMVCEGSVVQCSELDQVVLGYDCFVGNDSSIVKSVLLSGCAVGDNATLKGVLFDKNCRIESGTVIGHDPTADRERFPWITPGGIIVLPKGTMVPRKGPIRLAYDMAELLLADKDTAEQMTAFEGRYEIASRHRHSYWSVGAVDHHDPTAWERTLEPSAPDR